MLNYKINEKILYNIKTKVNNKSIMLIGLMGVGKSSIAKEMSKILSVDLIDTDYEIEKKIGTTITNFFKKNSEKEFREIEKKLILDMLDSKSNSYGINNIMAIGGGAFINKDIRKLSKKNSITIWLKADLNIIYKRVKEKINKRPLLEEGNVLSKLNKLAKERNKFYSMADITVETSNKSKNLMANKVLYYLHKYLLTAK